ncbi:MAG: serine/threonine-protein kinase [Candidatus Krumholzibacteria bacterium]|nr:serine/threonine-protein kinase [Candidatus Krumholzibacteria bacterium]
MIGQRIGNYQITDKLGAGGMGEVFRARDTQLGRDVAVKALPDVFAADPDRLTRFEREAKLLAGLNHTNIGAIYGIEESEGRRFLILELVEGEDVAQRLLRGPLPVEEVLEVSLQIAEALEAAHDQGVIHRDLKPANIQLTPEGHVKVLDFGLAKALDATGSDSSPDLSKSPTVMASSPTIAGVILGTAPYMSPEQARGKAVDKRADIFAFGAVLYEMLTGQQLFTGETVSDTLAAVLRAAPSLESLPADTPPALRTLLERCLDKDPKRRLRDIGEARITIENIRSGAADSGQGPVGVTAPRPGFLRSYGGWIAAGVVAIAAVALMTTMSRDPAVEVPLRKSSIMFSHDDPSVAGAFDPAISPNGRYIAYVSDEKLWVRDLSAVEPRVLNGTEGALQPFWSPDSDWIGFGLGNTLQKVSREGGQPALIATLPSGIQLAAGSSAAWTADGRIVIGPATAGLYAVSAQGGDVTSFIPPAEGETDFHEVCALPDGKGWVIVVHSNEGIGNLDAASPDGSRYPLLRVDGVVAHPSYSPSGHIVFHRSSATPGLWALPISLESLEATGDPFLVAPGGQDPTVSDDGTLVYAHGVHSQQAEIVWLNRTGDAIQTIGRRMSTTRPFPLLSPDGQSIVLSVTFGDARELYLYDVTSGNDRRLTFNDLREDLATFHPNGKDIYFYETGKYGTHSLSLDGSGERRGYENAIMADFTPDGSQIVFARQRPGEWDWDICVMPADGGAEDIRELVVTDGVDWWPRLSPNGRYLLYVTDETGQNEVYATTFPNPTTRWQISTGGGEWPRWRADGREIFYTTRTSIMAVDVNTEGGLTLGAPKELFVRTSINWSTRWADGFDVSGDGQNFVMLRPVRAEDDVQPSIVVVQNWFAEFGRTNGR